MAVRKIRCGNGGMKKDAVIKRRCDTETKRRNIRRSEDKEVRG